MLIVIVLNNNLKTYTTAEKIRFNGGSGIKDVKARSQYTHNQNKRVYTCYRAWIGCEKRTYQTRKIKKKQNKNRIESITCTAYCLRCNLKTYILVVLLALLYVLYMLLRCRVHLVLDNTVAKAAAAAHKLKSDTFCLVKARSLCLRRCRLLRLHFHFLF